MGSDLEDFRNFKKTVEAQTLFTTLHTCDIIGMQRNLSREGFLGQTKLPPIAPNIASNNIMEVHASKLSEPQGFELSVYRIISRFSSYLCCGMRWTAVILLLTSSASQGVVTAFGQMKMGVHLKSGKNITYDIGQIAGMSFTNEPPPKYWVISFYSRSSSAYPWDPPTSSIDTLTFEQAANQYSLYGFPVAGIDSITFAEFETDTNVVQFSNQYWDSTLQQYQTGDYHSAVWYGNRIYCTVPLRYFDVDSNYRITHDSTPWPLTLGGLALRLSQQGSKLLFVNSRFPDVSIGNLFEYDLLGKTYSTLLTYADSAVSSAAYIGRDSIIYYTYGSYSTTNRAPTDAGYYLFNRATGSKTLLLHFISDLGPGEMVNGFDISPDGKKLLMPAVGNGRMPLIIEYDFTTRVSDTLNVPFSPSLDRWALWLRYSHDGTKILYDNYPVGSFSNSVYDSSEVGIIDRVTLAKRLLQTSPISQNVWISVLPEWSPDDMMIVYGCGEVLNEPPGTIAGYQVCILKELK